MPATVPPSPVPARTSSAAPAIEMAWPASRSPPGQPRPDATSKAVTQIGALPMAMAVPTPTPASITARKNSRL